LRVHRYCRQVGAIGKRTDSYVGDAAGNGDVGQEATEKLIGSDAGDVGADGNTGQVNAIVKRSVFDTEDAVGNDDVG